MGFVDPVPDAENLIDLHLKKPGGVGLVGIEAHRLRYLSHDMVHNAGGFDRIPPQGGGYLSPAQAGASSADVDRQPERCAGRGEGDNRPGRGAPVTEMEGGKPNKAEHRTSGATEEGVLGVALDRADVALAVLIHDTSIFVPHRAQRSLKHDQTPTSPRLEQG